MNKHKYSIICGDNVESLSKMSENTFDACITDGPYGMEMDIWDKHVPPVETWQAVYRTLKPGAFVVSFCSPQLYHQMAVNIEEAGFVPLDMVFWINTTKMAKKNRLKPAHEPIMIAQKPLEGSIKKNQEKWGCGEINIDPARIPWDKPPVDQPVGGHTRRSFGKDVDKFEGGKTPANPLGRYPSNIVGAIEPQYNKYFYAPRATRKERGEYNTHPTPKPIDLMRYLVKIYSPVGGHVLDPFNGSGSTGIATLKESRQYTGLDLSQEYCDITEQRIKDHCEEKEILPNNFFKFD